MRRGFMPSKDSEHGRIPAALPPTTWYCSLAAANLKRHGLDPVSRYWLQLEGSLTRALQLRCQQGFHVEVAREGFYRPTREEALTLGIPMGQVAWIREVRLCGDDTPWVLARTIIPRSTLRGADRRLKNLGRTPLGAYLFSSQRWSRGPLQTGLCHRRDQEQPPVARRSLFHSGERRLLVGEYFLPALLARPDSNRT